MINAKDFMEMAQMFHGHKCPAMHMGLRTAAAAMNALGVERSKDSQLIAFVELGEGHFAHCFGDGIQVVTGCTFGKGNIRQLGYGKFGLILVEKATHRAVRVVPRGEVQLGTKQTPFFTQYREKGIPASAVPPEHIEPLIERIMSMPDEKLLKISEVFEYPLEDKEESFASFLCERCGDTVVEKYGRIFGDMHVCIPCYEELSSGRDGTE